MTEKDFNAFPSIKHPFCEKLISEYIDLYFRQIRACHFEQTITIPKGGTMHLGFSAIGTKEGVLEAIHEAGTTEGRLPTVAERAAILSFKSLAMQCVMNTPHATPASNGFHLVGSIEISVEGNSRVSLSCESIRLRIEENRNQEELPPFSRK